MSEETQPTPEPAAEATTESEAPVEDAAPEAATEGQAQAPVFDLARALDEAPAEELRRHPKFAGIVGSEKQRWLQDYQQSKQAEDEAAARVKAEEELRQLAEQNPVAFADRWLSSEQARQQQERVAALETNARQAIGKSIGAAFHAIPEWGDIARDPDALAALSVTMQGKSADDVLPAWNAAAVEMVAARRAEKLVEARIAERLKAERSAWETEAAAQGFRGSDRPDLVRGGRIATADPEPDFQRDPKAWDAWWGRNK